MGKILGKGASNARSKPEDALLHFLQVTKSEEDELLVGTSYFLMAKLYLREKLFYEAFNCLKKATEYNLSNKRVQLY
jgi:hypothetical protein